MGMSDEHRHKEWDLIMRVQQQIMAEHQTGLVGRELDVLVDGRNPDGEGLVGRTVYDAPEVDGVVFLPAGAAETGDLVRARIVGAEGYDLRGEVLAR